MLLLLSLWQPSKGNRDALLKSRAYFTGATCFGSQLDPIHSVHIMQNSAASSVFRLYSQFISCQQENKEIINRKLIVTGVWREQIRLYTCVRVHDIHPPPHPPWRVPGAGATLTPGWVSTGMGNAPEAMHGWGWKRGVVPRRAGEGDIAISI